MVDKKVDDLRSDGFLSRWAQRKQAVKAGLPLAEPPAKPVTLEKDTNLQEKPPVVQVSTAQAAMNNVADVQLQEVPAEIPPPTLDDARALTTESDFKPFMAKNVSPEVKNAAMKKLFTDPHYNVMDMLDTYVDDYSKSDPIPDAMLREMVSVKFLKLFEREEEEVEAPAAAEATTQPIPRDDADTPATQTVAQLDPSVATELPFTTPSQPAPTAASHFDHDHPDLRLQPNDAPERPGARRSPG
jgi:Protein of unknown function (DUF3306)